MRRSCSSSTPLLGPEYPDVLIHALPPRTSRKMGYLKPTNGRRLSSPSGSGFTLLEVMMGTLITSIVFAGVLSAYIFLGRALIREGNLEILESRTRTTLYQFTQDVSTATGVAPAGMTSSSLVLYEPSAISEVIYTFNSVSGQLTRTPPGSATQTIMLNGLVSFAFGYFDSYGITTSNPNAVKQINITYTTSSGSAIAGSFAHFNVVSPRVILKNKPYLQ